MDDDKINDWGGTLTNLPRHLEDTPVVRRAGVSIIIDLLVYVTPEVCIRLVVSLTTLDINGVATSVWGFPA
jgi:hypothetical protein